MTYRSTILTCPHFRTLKRDLSPFRALERGQVKTCSQNENALSRAVSDVSFDQFDLRTQARSFERNSACVGKSGDGQIRESMPRRQFDEQSDAAFKCNSHDIVPTHSAFDVPSQILPDFLRIMQSAGSTVTHINPLGLANFDSCNLAAQFVGRRFEEGAMRGNPNEQTFRRTRAFVPGLFDYSIHGVI